MAAITLLSLVFRPDNVSTAQLMADLAEDLQARGHRITVITTVPHYNHDPVARAEQALRPCWGPILRQSEYKGIRVYHTWMPAKGQNKFYRLITWLGFHLLSTATGLFKVPKPDLIISPSPPLTIGISAWLIALFRRAKFIYNVQEIYPDVAINLGAVRNRWVIKQLFALERFVYDRAALVTVISSRMLERLRHKGVPPEKLMLVPNFVDMQGFIPLPKVNAFSEQYGLADKFLITYAGNMGKPQQLEMLIRAAGLLRHHSRVHFLLMGSGSECDNLQRLAAELHLSNVTFLSHQSYSVVPMAYAASDICYVPQAIGTSNDGIPSKVYRILAAGRAVLACTDDDSDLADLIRRASAGCVVTRAEPQLVADAIQNAMSDESTWKRCGENGRGHVAQEYDRSVVGERYHRLILAIVNCANTRNL